MLLTLIKHQPPDMDKNYQLTEGSFESKYQILVNVREKVGIK